MKSSFFPAFAVGSILFFTACQKHDFERRDSTPVEIASVDSMQISEITSGGGVSENADEGIQVQATIGHLLYSPQVADGETQPKSDTGIWNILGNIF